MRETGSVKKENSAFAVESALIDAYPGITNAQGGHDPDFGVANTAELEQAYKAETIEKFPDKCLIIKIRPSTVSERGSVYEAVSSAWRIGKDRNETKCVFAVIHGVVKGVFKEIRWQQLPPPGDRWEFTAREITGSEFLNQRIPDKYGGKTLIGKGTANPVLYTW